MRDKDTERKRPEREKGEWNESPWLSDVKSHKQTDRLARPGVSWPANGARCGSHEMGGFGPGEGAYCCSHSWGSGPLLLDMDHELLAAKLARSINTVRCESGAIGRPVSRACACENKQTAEKNQPHDTDTAVPPPPPPHHFINKLCHI